MVYFQPAGPIDSQLALFSSASAIASKIVDGEIASARAQNSTVNTHRRSPPPPRHRRILGFPCLFNLSQGLWNLSFRLAQYQRATAHAESKRKHPVSIRPCEHRIAIEYIGVDFLLTSSACRKYSSLCFAAQLPKKRARRCQSL